jgi:hypothetical protein
MAWEPGISQGKAEIVSHHVRPSDKQRKRHRIAGGPGVLNGPRAFFAWAAELRLSTSALSHMIKGLEARLDLRLLEGNSRSVSVTAAGERL